MKYIFKNYGIVTDWFCNFTSANMLNVHDRHYYLFNDADFQIKGSLKTPPVTHATSSTLTQEVKKSGVSKWTNNQGSAVKSHIPGPRLLKCSLLSWKISRTKESNTLICFSFSSTQSQEKWPQGLDFGRSTASNQAIANLSPQLRRLSSEFQFYLLPKIW